MLGTVTEKQPYLNDTSNNNLSTVPTNMTVNEKIENKPCVRNTDSEVQKQKRNQYHEVWFNR